MLDSKLRRIPLVAAAAVIAVAIGMLGTVAPVAADPLSPQTGARIGTSGNPTAGSGGTVYYVDSVSGNNANSGTSTGSAWQSLAKVNSSNFVAGDVVAFKRGQTFSGSATIDNAGTSSNFITVTAYGSGNQPILTNPGGWYMLRLDAAYIKVDDLAFTNGAVFDNADGLGIIGAKYEQSGAVAISGNGSNVLVEDSTFTDVGVGVKTYGLNSKVQHNTFKDLRIAFRGFDAGTETSYGALGVSANNSGIDISYNDFINCRSTDSPYGADGGAIEIEGFLYNKNNLTIHHNYSRGSQGFLEVTETTSSNVSLTYNVSDDYQQFIAWDTTTTPSGYLAANNTVVRSSDSSRLFDQYYYRVTGPAPASNWITIRNNIFQTSASFSLFNFPHDHNLFSPSVAIGYALGASDIVADARFVNPASRDLRLTLTSPAVDNGTTATAATDWYGNSTGVGLGVDIGAHEYQTPPAGGTNLAAEPGFETQTSITGSTSPWFSEGALTYGVDVNAGKSHTGLDNGWIAGSSSSYGAIRQTITVSTNTNYRLVVWVKSSSNLNDGWLGVKTTSGTVLGELRQGQAAAYTRYVVSFNSGSNSTVRLNIGMYGAGSSTWEQIDDIVLQQI